MKTLDKILLVLGIFIGLFVISMIVTFWKFQAIPEALVYATLGSGSSEAILTCIITCIKKKAKINDNV